MSRMLRAVATTWHGSTDMWLPTADLMLILGMVAAGIDNPDDTNTIEGADGSDQSDDLILHQAAADRFLELLDDPIKLRAEVDVVLAEAGEDLESRAKPDFEEMLGLQLEALCANREAYCESYARDGDVLRLRLDHY